MTLHALSNYPPGETGRAEPSDRTFYCPYGHSAFEIAGEVELGGWYTSNDTCCPECGEEGLDEPPAPCADNLWEHVETLARALGRERGPAWSQVYAAFEAMMRDGCDGNDGVLDGPALKRAFRVLYNLACGEVA